MQFTIYYHKESIPEKDIKKLKFAINSGKKNTENNHKITLKFNNKILVCENLFEDENSYSSKFNVNKNSITYIDGFINNHLELRNKLPNKYWHGNSQEETINELLSSFGPSYIIPELEGNYSIASINFDKKDIFVFSDKLRIKQIYIFNKRENPKTIISTEIFHIKNLLDKKDLRIDRIAKTQFFTFGYIKKPRTIFENIKGLKANEFIRFNFQENKISSLPSPTFQGIYENTNLEDLLKITLEKELNKKS